MRKSLATLLYQDLADVEVFVDERNQAHVHLQEPEGMRRQRHLLLRSEAFINWLSLRALHLTGEVPSSTPLKAVIRMLQARAEAGKRVTLWNRVARGPEGALFVDLCDKDGRAVRVDHAGWEVVPAPPLFHRYSHQRSLPIPVQGGDLRGLLSFLNLSSEADQVLFLASLGVALLPDIPQPILILYGPQGAAKTTAARLRRELIDPSQVKTLLLRREVGELTQAIDHHYMPIFDNLTALQTAQEEILCQAATGAGATKRKLYTDGEDVIASFHRPVVLTGINLPSAAPDLLDRSLLIRLTRIDRQERKGEAQLFAAFEEEKPRLFGALLSALSAALRIEAELEFSGLPRMADFTRFGTAVSMALGYDGNFFLQALEGNVIHQGEEVVDGDAVAEAVRSLVSREGMVVGSSSKILELLLECAAGSSGSRGLAGFPRRPVELSRRLSLLQAPLSDLGILVQSVRSKNPDRQRIWMLADKNRRL